MNKYPRGRDIAVNWTLDLGGRTVDLASCTLLFEYHTGGGSKSVPRSEYTLSGDTLEWTFTAADQVAYGVYGLRLVANDGMDDIVFRLEDAFEIIHGEPEQENEPLPLESSVETEQDEPEPEPEEEEGTPLYVSSSPIHVEKVPLGSNLVVRWRLLTPQDFDFRLEDCTLGLYYAAAGSGFQMAADYSLDTQDGYVLTWNFSAAEQVRFGLYSLLLDVRQDGVKIATLVKDDAFALVHRQGSSFRDRVIDFESVVTTFGAGALYSLIDVRNDGYSTVYRADGVTPAVANDLLIYDGQMWHAVDGEELSFIRGLKNDFASLEVTTEGIFARVTDLEGDVGELWLTAREFGVRMTDAEGYIGQLTLTARQFEVRMTDAEGNIGQLTLTSQQFAVRMSDAEGNIGQLTLTSQQFGVRMSDIEGNVGQLTLTAEELAARMTDAEGNIGQLTLTAEEFAVRMSDAEGNVSLLQQTASSLTTRITDAEGNISTLEQTATSLTSRIQSAEGSISTIAQTAESIQLQVDNQAGDIATLEVSARAITSRVSDAEGNISILEQTATSLTSAIQDAEGNISVLQQTASSLTSAIQDAEGNISQLQQTATSLTSRIGDAEGNISTLQQTATSLTSRIGDAEGNISTLQQTATSLTTRIGDAEGNISTLQQTATSFGTRITNVEGDVSTISQNVGSIELRVQTNEGNISSLTTSVDGISAEVQALTSDLDDYETFVDGVLENIQDQIDGAIDTWFYNGTPTLNNLPASEWTTNAIKDMHLGDVYYDNLSGYAYRFTKDSNGYFWTEITDSAVVDALARASRAQDTADNKRRVFLVQPTPPYDAGDLWVQGHTNNNDGTIYRCIYSRATGSFVSSDWELASDLVNQNVMRANFDVLANAIIGTVAEYGSDGKITSNTATQFRQTVSDISFSVTKVGSALLPTGINIADQIITIRSDNFILAGNGVGSPAALTLTYRNNVPYISAANLDVTGILSTQAWSDKEQALQGYADSAAGDAYTDAVAQAATDAASYITTNVAPLISAAQSTADAAQTAAGNAQSAVNGLGYLASALGNGTTAIGGGLILSSLIGLGGNSGSGGAWELWSGVNGQYVATSDTSDPDFVAGHGIAAWYGGAMVDREDLTHYWTAEQIASWNAMTDAQRETSNLAAKTLFRMDGSGYLANGAISWGAAGDLHLLDNVYIGPNMDHTLESISTWVTLLSTWFKDDTISINGTNYRVLRVNMASDPASTTGFQGVVWNGFLRTGGDQIVFDGTPGGGGGGGGATNLYNLLDVYGHESEVVKRADGSNVRNGDVLAYNSNYGAWVASPATSGTVTSVTLAPGTNNGTLKLTVNGTATDNIAVTGLGSMAYKSSLAASDIPDLSGTYLPKTGGEIKTAAQAPLTINRNGGGGVSSILYKYNDNTPLGYLGIYLNRGPIYSPDYSTFYDIYHSGNFTPGNYVLKAGDTMTGTLTLPITTTGTALTGEGLNFGSSAHIGALSNGTFAMYAEGTIYLRPGDGTMSTNYGLVMSSTTVTYNGYAVWHAGNDGTGSGLDADLLDGQHGSYYAPLSALDNYLPLTAGTSKPLTGSLYIITGDTDKAIQFSYATSHLAGASWRLIYEGSNSADNNYFSIQNGGSNPSDTTWNNVVRMTMDTRRVGINMDSPQYQLDVAGSFRASTAAVIGTTLSVGGLSTLTGGATIPSTASLKIGNATITWNSNGYLHIDQPLVTAGDQIVISGTPGGGGGGGATTLWGLDDVNIPHDSSYPGNGDLLAYDLSTHKWVNVAASSVGGVTSVAGRTGAITLTTSDITNIETWISGKNYITSSALPGLVSSSANGLAPMYTSGNRSTSASTNTYYFLGWNGTGSTASLLWYSLPANAFKDTTYTNGTGISLSGTTFSLNVSGAKTALGLGSMAYETAGDYVTLAGAQTISGTKTFTGGIALSTASAFGSSDRAIYFSSPTDPSLMMYYNMSSTLGLFYNPATGALKAGSFVKHGGTASQFLKADGSVDSNTYLTTGTAASTYLPLSGGEIKSTDPNLFSVNRNGGGDVTAIRYKRSDNELSGYIGIRYGQGPVYSTDFSTFHTIYHSGNLSLATLAGSSQIGSSTQPVYYTGSALAACDLSTTYAPYNANGYLPLTGGTIHGNYGALVVKRDTNPYSSAIRFENSNGLLGYLGFKYDGSPVYSPDASTEYGFWHTGNSGSTSYPWSCSTLTTTSIIISGDSQGVILPFPDNSGKTCLYKVGNTVYVGAMGDGTTSTIGLVLRTRADDVYHSYTGNSYKMWDARNSNTTSVPWSCSDLTTQNNTATLGSVTKITMLVDSRGYLAEIQARYDSANWSASNVATGSLRFLTADNTGLVERMFIDAAGNVGIGVTSTTYKLDVAGSICATGNVVLYNAAGYDTPYLIFQRAALHQASSYDFGMFNSSGNLYFQVSKSTSGWQTMAYLDYNGNLVSVGDQVISSDLTLKENLTPVTYSVKDIAKARAVEFDWKDGRGHSMGSIAQDWLGIAPALVHGEEGKMSLAYGQLALVNTILLARQSESHEERIKELEARVAELESENQRLRMN